MHMACVHAACSCILPLLLLFLWTFQTAATKLFARPPNMRVLVTLSSNTNIIPSNLLIFLGRIKFFATKMVEHKSAANVFFINSVELFLDQLVVF